MTEVIGSLNTTRMSLQEGRPSQRTRQGAGQPEARAKSRAEERRPPEAQAAVGARELEAMAEELNKALGELAGNVSVSVDEPTGMVVVRIRDGATGEIVKQIPPQQILDADISMDKIIGILVDDLA